LQIAAGLSVLSEPFLPFTSKKLTSMLNLQKGAIAWNEVSEKEVLLVGGHAIGKATLLFAKIEDAEVQKQLDKLAATKLANEAESKVIETQKETVTFENFTKMDIRIGTIVEAEKMPKTKKLLVLKVDTGIDIRTIVSGIAESFKPEEIIGQKVAVLVNLAPRKLRGVESQGMILMTDTKEGQLAFLQPSTNAVANGTQVS
jgi:methionyl-tRNA synthetase